MNNKQYWLNRKQQQIHVASLNQTKLINKQVRDIYARAVRNIDQDIQNVWYNFSKKTATPLDELQGLLSANERTEFLNIMREKLAKLGFKVGEVYPERYLYRLSRLDALKQNVYWDILNTGQEFKDLADKNFSREMIAQYRDTIKNLSETLKIQPNFTELTSSNIFRVLEQNYKGDNFSSRLWANTTRLADEVTLKLGADLTMGRSYAKTAMDLRQLLMPDLLEDVGNARYVTTRLVRTETARINGQASIDAFQQAGIDRVMWTAEMEGNTCPICSALHEKVFDINDPSRPDIPQHPNCNCDWLPVFEEEAKAPLIRKRSQTK